ncbi:MAG: 5'-nucleotidase [Ignavibacteriae bacterium]|nr:MAG: 5'-nucleotidase [Ignavibacteriota bacterium]
MHAAFIPHEAFWVRDSVKPLVGGFIELSATVDSIKNVKNVLLLDAGDVMTGNPITEYKYKGAYGGALFEMMNMIGYDAWCPGNHDFDISQDNFVKLTKVAKFPTISANLVNKKNKRHLNNKDYVIIERAGIKIGIIGIISQQLYSLVNQNNLKGIKVLSPLETLQNIINKIDDKTDLIIALTHQGFVEDSILATNITGLDIIIGSHSHTRIRNPKLINGVIVAQAGSDCENLGELYIEVENDKVINFNGKLIQLWHRPDRKVKNIKLAKFVDSIKRVVDKDYNKVIAELETDWKRENGESNIGNFITDAQRIAVHADVAFMNNHGIRKDLSRGPVTRMDLFNVLPFRNVLTTFQLTGKQIKSIVEYIISTKSPVQTSGIKCQYKKQGERIEFIKFEIQGKPLDEEKSYICTVNDYMLGEAKRYLGIEIPVANYLNMTLYEEVEKYLKKVKKVNSQKENRLEEVF